MPAKGKSSRIGLKVIILGQTFMLINNMIKYFGSRDPSLGTGKAARPSHGLPTALFGLPKVSFSPKVERRPNKAREGLPRLDYYNISEHSRI